MKRVACGFALIFGLLSLVAAPDNAAATNHITRLDQVMIGAFGRSDIQYVVVTASDCSQKAWGPQFGETQPRAGLFFFDKDNNPVGQFLFQTDPPCGSSNSVLIGTQAFKDLPPPTPDPDFVMPVLGKPGSGKVCFKSNPANNVFSIALCLTYGDFNGDTEQSSTNDAPALLLQDICALKRDSSFSSFGSNANDDFSLLPSAPMNTSNATAAVVVPPRFADVPSSNPFFRFIEAMFNAGITSGCAGGNYCPNFFVTREQMAVFLLLAKEGAGFGPPACTVPTFSDVPCSSPFAKWIEELVDRGITSGCGGGKYCPTSAVTREQMAVFLLLAKEGAGFSPPACTVPTFSDVPCSSPFAKWIEELVDRGITSGCGGGKYCPTNPVTRAQMAVFLSSMFGLPVPVLPANTACTAPPPPPPGSCEHDKCVQGVALESDCDPCVAQICAADSFCCNTFWDSLCVGEVSSVCGLSCS
jgi:hypothetical protein